MLLTIRLVGGPSDGRSIEFSADVPPPIFLVPLQLPVLMWAPDDEIKPMETAEYEQVWQNHRPQRAADGAYLYRHRAVPLTMEQRQGLKEARQREKDERGRRESQLDETWQEMRKKRPGFPEDWRDLF